MSYLWNVLSTRSFLKFFDFWKAYISVIFKHLIDLKKLITKGFIIPKENWVNKKYVNLQFHFFCHIIFLLKILFSGGAVRNNHPIFNMILIISKHGHREGSPKFTVRLVEKWGHSYKNLAPPPSSLSPMLK